MKGATRAPARRPSRTSRTPLALRDFPVPGGAGGRQSWPCFGRYVPPKLDHRSPSE